MSTPKLIAGIQTETPAYLKLTTPTEGPVKSWSFSTLKDFETCRYKVYLAKVKKCEQPSSPALDRGSEIHEEAEQFVDGRIGEMPKSLKKFEPAFWDLRKEYEAGTVQLERPWAFTQDWNAPTGWTAPDTWVRIKLDAFWQDGPASGKVIDYKTGKKFGNEFKHSEQLQIYTIAAFLLFPEIEYIQGEMWYLDQQQTLVKTYTRSEALLFIDRWTKRGNALTTCVDFPPSPSPFTCRFCPFKETGACEWAA